MRQIRSVVFGYWPLIFASGFLAATFFIVRQDGYENVAFYPIFVWKGTYPLVLPCIIAPIGCFIILVSSWFVEEPQTKPEARIFASVLLVPIAILAFLNLGATIRDTFVHSDSVLLERRAYHLTSHNTWDDYGWGTFLLYECDGTGNTCRLVYETDGGFNTSQPATLKTDPITNSISIEIDGEIVYTYYATE